MSSPQGAPPQEAEKTAQPVATTAPFAIPPGHMMPPAAYQPYVYTAPVAFTPYPAPQQAFEEPKPASNKVWEMTKMMCHTLSIILAAVGVGLGFSTLNYYYFTYTVVIAAAPPNIIALVWSLAEMITRAARKFKAGIHPGAHIALSLIIFLVAVILTSLFGPWFQNSWYGSSSSSSNNGIDEDCDYKWNSTTHDYVLVCDSSPAYREAAQRKYDHEKSVALAAAVVSYLVAAIHFALFIGACVDTSKANSYASRPIYIIAPPQMQGWQPIQQAPVPAPVSAPVPAPVQTTTRDAPPAESEEQNQSKEKGKEPARGDDIVEHYAPSGSQA